MSAAPATATDFLDLLRKSGVLDAAAHAPLAAELAAGEFPGDAKTTAAVLVDRGVITLFQGEQLLSGKWRGFAVGKYKLLDRLGAGGMGQVFLAEHATMRRRVAVKVLPPKQAADPALFERFMREARAAGALSHPNIVRAYDIDQANGLHFLVMEHVDGSSLQQIVGTFGPMSAERVGHYMYQAALGLQHAHEAGLVHRDIKPANLLLERTGTVKLLDLGLARFFHADDGLTKQYDGNSVLGTADYLAPEQAMDSSAVDIRADIYALGATTYFLLTGKPPFEASTVAEKLVAHQVRPLRPLGEFRPDVPPALEAVVRKMMAKRPDDRYPTPLAVADALAPWGDKSIPAPDEREMPKRSGPAGMNSTATASRTGMRSAVRAARRAAGEGSTWSGEMPRPKRGFGGALLAAGGGLAVVAALAAGGWWYSTRQPAAVGTTAVEKRAATGTTTVEKPAVAAVTPPPKVEPPKMEPSKPTPRTLTVADGAGNNRYATLAAAVAAAKPGDRITVTKMLVGETLAFGSAARDLTITGGGSDGPLVNWTAGPTTPAGTPLIDIAGAKNVRLSGFLFDGGGRLDDLIVARGDCPNCQIERCELTGFRKNGVRAESVRGADREPFALRTLRVRGTDPAVVGVRVHSEALSPARGVVVNDCRFEGPGAAGVAVVGPVERSSVIRSRFFQLADGIRIDGDEALAVQLGVEGCAFHSLKAGVRVNAPANKPTGAIAMKQCAFEKVPVAVSHAAYKYPAPATAAHWLWTAEETNPAVHAPAGERYFRKAFAVDGPLPKRATLETYADDSGEWYLNGKYVGKVSWADHNRAIVGFDVTPHLKVGANVLAVRCVNGKSEPGKNNPASVVGRLTLYRPGAAPLEAAVTDATWKAGRAGPDGWQEAKFNDKDWEPALDEGAVGKVFGTAPWPLQAEPPLEGFPERLFAGAALNFRNPQNAQYVPFAPFVRAVQFVLPADPADDATFLRPAAGSALFKALNPPPPK